MFFLIQGCRKRNTSAVKWSLYLDSTEVSIESAKIDCDLKKDNLTKIVAELNAELKKQKLSAEARAQIKNEFEEQLNNFLKIQAYIETYNYTHHVSDLRADQ